MAVTTPTQPDRVELIVDGETVSVPDDGGTLLGALRDQLGLHSVKDGCSPQGQCGCCTVLVDGQPRVSCVTPLRRVVGRAVTTADGLDPAVAQQWGQSFCASGGSQCGFCTPGIVVRLERLRRDDVSWDDPKVARSLHAHLCRCTGWQTVLDAYRLFATDGGARDLDAAAVRAAIEGRTPQTVGPLVALGHGGFADDLAPADALVVVPDGAGGWALGETLAEARAVAGKIQGRRTTIEPTPPLELPAGDWAATLRTSWVEPAYLETDASWCEPGGEPASALGNGGAFGAKLASTVGEAARRLADESSRPVRVLLSREDTVRLGPKRPPVAGGARSDGTGHVRVVRTPGIAERIAAVAPRLDVTEIDVVGPPTSADIRGAGWVEAQVLLAGARGAVGPIAGPDTGVAEAEIVDGTIQVRVACGDVLDETVLRSYCIGAAHMAYSWVTSEGLAVDETGESHDLTVRSFGVVRATETPRIEVVIDPSPGEPCNGSDAVFAAVAAATWLDRGAPTDWPTR